MKQYTGKTLEDILEKIANENNVLVDSITYNVLETKQGFLGIGKEVTLEAYCDVDIKEFIRDYLQTYFDNMGMEVSIEFKDDEEKYMIELNCKNNAILIGKGGQTLQAINYVVRSATSNMFKKRISCLIDINGYKEERYKKVCNIAQRVARTVARTKVDALLDPMTNDERKAIHQCLSRMPHIATKSEGEGMGRRLRIVYSEKKKGAVTIK